VTLPGIEMRALFGTARVVSGRAGYVLAAAAGFLALAYVIADPDLRMLTVVSGLSLAALVLIVRGLAVVADGLDRRHGERLFMTVADDAAPCFSTDAAGVVQYRNVAAEDRFGPDCASMLETLSDHIASPAAVLFRLQSRADVAGAAREDMATRQGTLRLAVHATGSGRFLWRVEEFRDRGFGARGAELLSLPMLVLNKGGVILFSNEAMRRLLGQRPKRIEDVLHGGVIRSGEEVTVMGHDGPLRAILAEVAGQGERREIFLLPSPDREGTEAVGADFEHVPVALMTFAPDGALRVANKAARDLMWQGDLGAAMFHDLFEGLGRPVADWLGDVVAERLPVGSEVVRARRMGEDSFLQVTLRRIVEAGRPGVLAVLNDATKLKTLEAQFAQSQKMQAIGQLAGGIAHDFNNLLTAISGHCDLLLLQHGREDADYADLEQIRQNANRAAALVGQLLAFSRKQTLKPEQLDLAEVLSDLTHLLNRLVGEKVGLTLVHTRRDGGRVLGQIRADKRQLEQVLMNLVVNARDAMPEGGTIRIETEALRLAEALQRDRAAVPAGDYAVIRVIDHGTGIPADRLQKIFEPFYTTKRVGEGTGLGLSTAYGIVKQSGGFIFVDSVVGEGTCFTLYFPLHVGELTAGPAPEAPRKALVRQGEGVVLLVEDEAPVRAFASRALRLRGYTVLEAESAEAALTVLEDPLLAVDVFVTDVVMPGMDGPSWVRIALQDRPDVPVIFVSGYAEDCLSEGQARIPNSVFLPKPFSLNDLTATVQGQLT
jgi:two-component system, cell cycle sensor histidine kinase and response regulator CckA